MRIDRDGCLIGVEPNDLDENGKLVIPSKVTLVCFGAFEKVKSLLKRVDIEEGARIIGAESFIGCNQLEEVNLPNSLKRIEESAFSGCVNLKKINLPEGLQDVQMYAFENCKSLKSIDIPSSLGWVGTLVFHGCSEIEKVVIRGNKSTIAKARAIISSCRKLNELDIKENTIEFWKRELQCYPDSFRYIPSKLFKNNSLRKGLYKIMHFAIYKTIASTRNNPFLKTRELADNEAKEIYREKKQIEAVKDENSKKLVD